LIVTTPDIRSTSENPQSIETANAEDVSVRDFEMLSTIMASSIHEIKNGFNNMLRHVEHISDELPENHEVHQQAKAIQTEALYMSHQLTQLLVCYKNGNEGYKLSIRHHDMEHMLEDLVDRHEVTTGLSHQCHFNFECEQDLIGFFDEPLILNVIDTAINNAAREEGVTSIQLSACESENYLQISICDDGPGFPTELLTSLENNDQSKGSRTARQTKLSDGKTGLGLHFAQTIVSLHKHHQQTGYIVANNDSPLGGARLSIMLPH